jgi:L-ascorbate metabolism protein UlaG (beta-lactamase superfamily)
MTDEKKLSHRNAVASIAEGYGGCWSLGGSGFVLKTSKDASISLDPYLSIVVEDTSEQNLPFRDKLIRKRFRPLPSFSTHWHEDHLDLGLIPVVARNNPHAKSLMPPSVTAHALSWEDRWSQIVPLHQGQTSSVEEVIIEAKAARHEANIPG